LPGYVVPLPQTKSVTQTRQKKMLHVSEGRGFSVARLTYAIE
jgi:hypothetical protein